MNRRSWNNLIAVGLTLCLFLISTLPLLAQEPINLRIDRINDSGFPQMQVQVAVRNNNGVPVPGLTSSDFEIAENGISLKPTRVESATNPQVKLAVALVIDISGSMRADDGKPLQDAKDAANAFLDMTSEDDQTAVIAFGDKVDLGEPFPRIDPEREQDFTFDKNALRNVINFLEAKKCAGTPLYDAAFKAVKMTARQPRGNRAVILMTDGRDAKGVLSDSGQCREVTPGSEVVTSEDPIAEANRNNIPVFTIGLGENIDSGYLQRLALRTGGTYQQTPDSAQLTELYKNIAELLKQQYVLSYTSQVTENTPPVTDDGKYSLVVRATYGGAQAIDEAKFLPPFSISPATTAVETAEAGPTRPVIALATTVPTAVPTPVEEVSGISKFIQDNRMLVIALAVLAGLALILLLVLLVLRRRQAADEEEWGFEGIQTDLYDQGLATSATSESRQDTPMPPTDVGPVAPVDVTEQSPALYQAPPGRPGAAETMIIAPKPKALGFFIVKQGPQRGSQLSLDRPETKIGREATNDIVLDDPTVSREHAVVKLEDDDFYIYDLGSANGTLVGDEKITKHQLHDEDEVTVGETVLVFKSTKLED